MSTLFGESVIGDVESDLGSSNSKRQTSRFRRCVGGDLAATCPHSSAGAICRPGSKLNRTEFLPRRDYLRHGEDSDILDTNDRAGPQCREEAGGSVGVTVQRDLSGKISPQRSNRPTAHRKRPRSISCVFGSIGGGDGRDRRGGSDSFEPRFERFDQLSTTNIETTRPRWNSSSRSTGSTRRRWTLGMTGGYTREQQAWAPCRRASPPPGR